MRRTNPIVVALGLWILQACGPPKNPELLSELRERSLSEGLALAESFGRQITIYYFDGTSEGRAIEGSRYLSFGGPQILVGQTPSGILLAKLDGAVFAKSSANLDASTAALSPDGNLIAFIGRNRDEDTARTGLQYGPLNSRSFHLIDQSVDTGEDPNRPFSPIGWSPDGHSISYARDGHVYIYDLDKGRSRVLTAGTNSTWSPAGTWIAYKSPRNEPAIIRPDGTGMRSLVTKEIVYGVHWSPDGDYVAFQERLLVSGQIVVIRLRDGAQTAVLRDRAFSPTDSDVSWVKTPRRHPSMPARMP